MFSSFQSRDSHINNKIDRKFRDCVPTDLSEKLGNIQTSIFFIKESLAEIKEDLRSKE